ncbi:hypothetical protein PCANC_24034 [Puccinia coronata f. sp. avenae]|uniref:Uncharacterized protein n=1 Tax=Puccinia coronata f. sp. avenae TaxID=200324 RepID=A0A2N5S952_9BASI|nr:hypothetical protein PCANC_24034 [Puccinia coronata f. sp. avenae]
MLMGGVTSYWPGQHVSLAQESTIARFDTNTATQWPILLHYGTHNHPWSEAKKPDKLAKEKLKTAVSKNPKEGAFSLKEFVNKKIIQIKKDFSNAKPNQIAFANLSGLLDEGNKFLDSQKRDDVQTDELVASHHSTEMQMPKDGPRKTASNQHAGSKQQTQAILADSSQKPAESTPEQQALPKFQRLKIKVGPQAKPVAVLPQPKDPSDPASIPVPVPACRPGQRSKRVAKAGKQ